MIRLDRLPPGARVVESTTSEAVARRRRVHPGGSWRCAKCGNVETVYAKAQRHADAERHPRIEFVLR